MENKYITITRLFISLYCILLFSSCAKMIQVEKKRYSKGYYVSISSRKPAHARVSHKRTKRPGQSDWKKAVNVRYLAQNDTAHFSYENKEPDNAPGKLLTNQLIKKKRGVYLHNSHITSLAVTLQEQVAPVQGAREVSVSQKEKKAKDYLFLLYSGIFILGSLALFRPFITRTKNIAYWAKTNPHLAKGALAVIQTVLITGGIFAGKGLYNNNILTSDSSTYALLTLTAAAAFFEPLKKVISSRFKRRFMKQKFHFFTVGLLSTLLFINLGNRAAADKQFSPSAASLLFAKNDRNATELIAIPGQSNLMKGDPEKKAMRTALKIVFTVMISIGAFGLLCLVAALACELVCLGEIGLAILVGFGGMGLAVSILIISIDAIWEKGMFKKVLPKTITGT